MELPKKALVRLSVCGDEFSNTDDDGRPFSTAAEQAAGAMRVGIGTISVRFFSFEGKMLNILGLNNHQLEEVAEAMQLQGRDVDTICTPIGKSWLSSSGGPSHAKYLSFEEITIQTELAIAAAKKLGAKAVRIFSGYGSDWISTREAPKEMIADAAKIVGHVASLLRDAGLLTLLENEKYLAGWSGETAIRIIEAAGMENVLVAYDFGNAQHVGLSRDDILGDFLTVLNAGRLGTIHLKECKDVPANTNHPDFDEKKLGPFHCVAGTGDAGIEAVFREFASNPTATLRNLARFGFRGLPCMVEGHLKSGGPYMGCSGPQGVTQIVNSMMGIWGILGIDIS